jgi:hypothetical protein
LALRSSLATGQTHHIQGWMIMQTKRPFVVLPCKSKTVRADQIGRVAILRNLLAASGIDIPTGNSLHFSMILDA